jgi:hypothetical protein
MSQSLPPDARERLQLAFEMFELGRGIKLEQLRRLHPEASPAELEENLAAWLMERPEPGDVSGPVRVRDGGS